MHRRWFLALTIAGALFVWNDPAHAQRGGRGRGSRGMSQTPFGPIPGGMTMPDYANVLRQRQQLQMQQQQARMQQALRKQQQQFAKQQAKQDDGKEGRKGDRNEGRKGDREKADDTATRPAPPRFLTPAERRKQELEKIAQARANLGLTAKPAATPPPAVDPTPRDEPPK